MADSVDRRATERMPVSAGAVCSFAGPVAEEFGGAKVRDVSLDGIGLVLTRKVETGSLLAVNLAHPGNGLAKTLLVRVANVTPVHGGFLVGGSFIAPLTYQELTALVM